MTITLPAERKTKITDCFLNVRSHCLAVSICDPACQSCRLYGLMPPFISFWGKHYQSVANDKIQALKTSRGN